MFKSFLVLAPIAASAVLTISAPATAGQPPDLTEMLIAQAAGGGPGGRGLSGSSSRSGNSAEPPVEIYDSSNPTDRARPDAAPSARRDTKPSAKRDTEPSARRNAELSARRNTESGAKPDTEPSARP